MKRMLHDYLTIWRHRDLRLMIPARAISAFGDDMALLVLMLRVYADGRGPWSITILLLCATVPVVVLAPVAGRLVDTIPFRTLASVAAALAGGLLRRARVRGPVVARLRPRRRAPVGPGRRQPRLAVALVPEIAEPDEIGQAMGASQSLSTLAAVAAPAVAGVLAGMFGYGAPLLIDAATFAGLAAAALAIHATRRQSAADPATNAPPPAAFSLRKDALLWPLVLGVCALVLVGESTNVVEVFLLRGTLGAGTVVFGLVAAMLAVGVVAGSLFAGRNAPDGRQGDAHRCGRTRPRPDADAAGLTPACGCSPSPGRSSASPTASPMWMPARCC